MQRCNRNGCNCAHNCATKACIHSNNYGNCTGVMSHYHDPRVTQPTFIPFMMPNVNAFGNPGYNGYNGFNGFNQGGSFQQNQSSLETSKILDAIKNIGHDHGQKHELKVPDVNMDAINKANDAKISKLTADFGSKIDELGSLLQNKLHNYDMKFGELERTKETIQHLDTKFNNFFHKIESGGFVNSRTTDICGTTKYTHEKQTSVNNRSRRNVVKKKAIPPINVLSDDDSDLNDRAEFEDWATESHEVKCFCVYIC